MEAFGAKDFKVHFAGFNMLLIEYAITQMKIQSCDIR